MSDDLFESEITDEQIETTAPAEPTAEEITARSFEEGVANVSFGQNDDEQDEPVTIAGFSEDEIRAAIEKANRYDELKEQLTKSHDKAFGKIGQLEQMIRDGLATRQQQAAEPIQISKDVFKSVAAYFDDDALAEALANDLSALPLGGQTTAPTFDMSAIDERVSTLQNQFETKLLTIKHPDWRELVATEEFESWRKTLKPEAVEILDNSWDGVALSGAFDKFKSWRDKQTEKAESKRKALEDAIPAGTGKTSTGNTVAEDAFNQGLKKVVNSRLHN